MARAKHTYYYRVYLPEAVWDKLIEESHLLGIDIEQFQQIIQKWAYSHFMNKSERFLRATAMACTLINPAILLKLTAETEAQPPPWLYRPRDPKWILIDLPPDVMEATAAKARKLKMKADDFRCRLIRYHLERSLGWERNERGDLSLVDVE